MAYAYIGSAEGSSPNEGVNTITTSLSLAVTTGDFVWFEASYKSNAAKTVNWPTTWGTVTTSNTAYNGTDQFGFAWGWVIANATTNAAATITTSANCDFPTIRVANYSGIASSSTIQINTLLNRQVNPGTGAGAVTASATLTGQPALVLGSSFALAAQGWNTAVNGNARVGMWDYGSGGTSFSAYPQDARRTSTGGYSATWTTNTGNDTYYSWITVVNESGGATDTPITVTNGTLTLTGQDVVLLPSGSEVLVVDNATLTLSGQDIQLLAGSNIVMPVTNASLGLQSQDVPFVLETPWTEGLLNLIGSNVNLIAGVSYTLSVDNASLTLTGQNINLLADEDYTLPVTAGSIVLVGQDVSFLITGNTSLVVDNGVLTMSGQELALNASFTISGSGTGVRRKRNRGIRRLLNIGR